MTQPFSTGLAAARLAELKPARSHRHQHDRPMQGYCLVDCGPGYCRVTLHVENGQTLTDRSGAGGFYYEGWLVGPEGAVSLGAFNLGPDGCGSTTRVVAASVVQPGRAELVRVTVEPFGGSQAGAIAVLEGRLIWLETSVETAPPAAQPEPAVMSDTSASPWAGFAPTGPSEPASAHASEPLSSAVTTSDPAAHFAVQAAGTDRSGNRTDLPGSGATGTSLAEQPCGAAGDVKLAQQPDTGVGGVTLVVQAEEVPASGDFDTEPGGTVDSAPLATQPDSHTASTPPAVEPDSRAASTPPAVEPDSHATSTPPAIEPDSHATSTLPAVGPDSSACPTPIADQSGSSASSPPLFIPMGNTAGAFQSDSSTATAPLAVQADGSEGSSGRADRAGGDADEAAAPAGDTQPAQPRVRPANPLEIQVQLVQRHPMTPRASGSATLNLRRGSLTLSLRGLPSPMALGRDRTSGRPFNAYRVWLVNRRSQVRTSVGYCERAWGENFRFEADGLPLNRNDTILITAEDRSVATSVGGAAPQVLIGSYEAIT